MRVAAKIVLVLLFVPMCWEAADYAITADDLGREMSFAKAHQVMTTADELRAHKAVSDADNAAIFYAKATQWVGPDYSHYARPETVLELASEPSGTGLPYAVGHLALHHELLALSEQATAKPGCNFNRQWELGPELLLPEYSQMKVMAKLLMARCYIQARMGNRQVAFRDFQRVLQIAKHVSNDPILIASLVSIAIYQIALKGAEFLATIWSNDEHELESLGAMIKDIQCPITVRQALVNEVSFTIVAMGALPVQRTLASSFHSYMSYDYGLYVPPLVSSRNARNGVLCILLRYWNEILDACKWVHWEPRAVRGVSASKLYEFSDWHLRPTLRIAGVFLPIWNGIADSFLKVEAKQRTLGTLIQILLRRVRRDGAFGKDLDFPFAPEDPFTGKRLRILSNGNSICVSSVGIDGVFEDAAVYEKQNSNYSKDVLSRFPVRSRNSVGSTSDE